MKVGCYHNSAILVSHRGIGMSVRSSRSVIGLHYERLGYRYSRTMVSSGSSSGRITIFHRGHRMSNFWVRMWRRTKTKKEQVYIFLIINYKNIFLLLHIILIIHTCFIILEIYINFFATLYLDNVLLMVPSGSLGGGSMGGSSRSSGWTDFDLGVLEEPFPDAIEAVHEVAHPNPLPNPVQAIPPEPDLDSVKEYIRQRLLLYRTGRNNSSVEESEINDIIDLKGQIIDRIAQLDFNPFWNQYRNRVIRDYLQSPKGGEFKIYTLEKKLQDLFGDNATSSKIYKELIRVRENFHIDGPFRGPRGR